MSKEILARDAVIGKSYMHGVYKKENLGKLLSKSDDIATNNYDPIYTLTFDSGKTRTYVWDTRLDEINTSGGRKRRTFKRKTIQKKTQKRRKLNKKLK